MGGVYTLVRVDYRLALLAIFVKSPILASLNQLSRKDIVKYGRLYDVSRYGAFFVLYLVHLDAHKLTLIASLTGKLGGGGENCKYHLDPRGYSSSSITCSTKQTVRLVSTKTK